MGGKYNWNFLNERQRLLTMKRHAGLLTEEEYELQMDYPDLDEDAASDAKQQGLTHKGFGNYADSSGKVVAKSQGGKLVPVGDGGGSGGGGEDKPNEKASAAASDLNKEFGEKVGADLSDPAKVSAVADFFELMSDESTDVGAEFAKLEKENPEAAQLAQDIGTAMAQGAIDADEFAKKMTDVGAAHKSAAAETEPAAAQDEPADDSPADDDSAADPGKTFMNDIEDFDDLQNSLDMDDFDLAAAVKANSAVQEKLADMAKNDPDGWDDLQSSLSSSVDRVKDELEDAELDGDEEEVAAAKSRLEKAEANRQALRRIADPASGPGASPF